MAEPAEGPSLHDAEIIEVTIDRSKSIARLTLRLEDGRMHSVGFEGLEAFRCEDLVLQNVASRVLRSSRKDFSRDRIDNWVTWITSLSDSTSWLNEQGRREWLSALSSGDLELIVFEPSAGAQVAAICEDFVSS